MRRRGHSSVLSILVTLALFISSVKSQCEIGVPCSVPAGEATTLVYGEGDLATSVSLTADVDAQVVLTSWTAADAEVELEAAGQEKVDIGAIGTGYELQVLPATAVVTDVEIETKPIDTVVATSVANDANTEFQVVTKTQEATTAFVRYDARVSISAKYKLKVKLPGRCKFAITKAYKLHSTIKDKITIIGNSNQAYLFPGLASTIEYRSPSPNKCNVHRYPLTSPDIELAVAAAAYVGQSLNCYFRADFDRLDFSHNSKFKINIADSELIAVGLAATDLVRSKIRLCRFDDSAGKWIVPGFGFGRLDRLHFQDFSACQSCKFGLFYVSDDAIAVRPVVLGGLSAKFKAHVKAKVELKGQLNGDCEIEAEPEDDCDLEIKPWTPPLETIVVEDKTPKGFEHFDVGCKGGIGYEIKAKSELNAKVHLRHLKFKTALIEKVKLDVSEAKSDRKLACLHYDDDLKVWTKLKIQEKISYKVKVHVPKPGKIVFVEAKEKIDCKEDEVAVAVKDCDQDFDFSDGRDDIKAKYGKPGTQVAHYKFKLHQKVKYTAKFKVKIKDDDLRACNLPATLTVRGKLKFAKYLKLEDKWQPCGNVKRIGNDVYVHEVEDEDDDCDYGIFYVEDRDESCKKYDDDNEFADNYCDRKDNGYRDDDEDDEDDDKDGHPECRRETSLYKFDADADSVDCKCERSEYNIGDIVKVKANKKVKIQYIMPAAFAAYSLDGPYLEALCDRDVDVSLKLWTAFGSREILPTDLGLGFISAAMNGNAGCEVVVSPVTAKCSHLKLISPKINQAAVDLILYGLDDDKDDLGACGWNDDDGHYERLAVEKFSSDYRAKIHLKAKGGKLTFLKIKRELKIKSDVKEVLHLSGMNRTYGFYDGKIKYHFKSSLKTKLKLEVKGKPGSLKGVGNIGTALNIWYRYEVKEKIKWDGHFDYDLKDDDLKAVGLAASAEVRGKCRWGRYDKGRARWVLLSESGHSVLNNRVIAKHFDEADAEIGLFYVPQAVQLKDGQLGGDYEYDLGTASAIHSANVITLIAIAVSAMAARLL